jgi:hypothetical protein
MRYYTEIIHALLFCEGVTFFFWEFKGKTNEPSFWYWAGKVDYAEKFESWSWPFNRNKWAVIGSQPKLRNCNNLTLYCHVKLLYDIFFESSSTTQTLTTRTHTHSYEYTYANPTSMSTSEGLSTGRSGDSRSHHRCLVIDGNVAYHLTHNVDKCWKV